MRFNAFLGSMLAAAYVANPKAHLTNPQAQGIVDLAYLKHMGMLTANGNTVKKAARMRGPNGEVIYVPSAKWVDRSCYRPHQGRQEMGRRVRQMKKVAG